MSDEYERYVYYVETGDSRIGGSTFCREILAGRIETACLQEPNVFSPQKIYISVKAAGWNDVYSRDKLKALGETLRDICGLDSGGSIGFRGSSNRVYISFTYSKPSSEYYERRVRKLNIGPIVSFVTLVLRHPKYLADQIASRKIIGSSSVDSVIDSLIWFSAKTCKEEQNDSFDGFLPSYLSGITSDELFITAAAIPFLTTVPGVFSGILDYSLHVLLDELSAIDRKKEIAKLIERDKFNKYFNTPEDVSNFSLCLLSLKSRPALLHYRKEDTNV